MPNLFLLSTALILFNSLTLFLKANSEQGIPQSKKHEVFISKASFFDDQFDNQHAGSAFFISFEDKVYGVTAKHVLYFAKTEKMTSIDFNGALKSWEFITPSDTTFSIKAGKLLNKNKAELLSEPLKGDWLIFEITDPLPESVHVFELSNSALKNGTPLTFKGYPYESNASLPVSIAGTFDATKDNYSFSMNVPQGNYAGCSGGPVLDASNKVVGLVSMGYFDQSTQKMVFEPASINYFKEFIASKN